MGITFHTWYNNANQYIVHSAFVRNYSLISLASAASPHRHHCLASCPLSRSLALVSVAHPVPCLITTLRPSLSLARVAQPFNTTSFCSRRSWTCACMCDTGEWLSSLASTTLTCIIACHSCDQQGAGGRSCKEPSSATTCGIRSSAPRTWQRHQPMPPPFRVLRKLIGAFLYMCHPRLQSQLAPLH